jgi:hypothetical protein
MYSLTLRWLPGVGLPSKEDPKDRTEALPAMFRTRFLYQASALPISGTFSGAARSASSQALFFSAIISLAGVDRAQAA